MEINEGFFIGILVFFLGGIIFLFISGIIQDAKKSEICSEDYGFKYSFWRGEGSIDRGYTYKSINETTFACCLKQDYVYEGEIRNLNCTTTHEFNELKK